MNYVCMYNENHFVLLSCVLQKKRRSVYLSYEGLLNNTSLLYLPLKETSILHSTVRLVQLLISVAHIFVPEPCLVLQWDIEQLPHLLLYSIWKEGDMQNLLIIHLT